MKGDTERKHDGRVAGWAEGLALAALVLPAPRQVIAPPVLTGDMTPTNHRLRRLPRPIEDHVRIQPQQLCFVVKTAM